MTRDIIHCLSGKVRFTKPYIVWVEDDRGEEE